MHIILIRFELLKRIKFMKGEIMFGFLEGMFENIGGKLKKYAKVLFVASLAGDVIGAFTFGIDRYYDEVTIVFWIFIICGPIVSYFQSALIYGFGELIEKATETKQLMEKVVNNDIVTPEQKEQKEIDEALKF